MEPRSRKTTARLAAAVAVAALVGLAPTAATAEDVAFTFAGAAVTTPLGLATDHAHARYWAVQSSSGTLVVQAFDARGARVGSTRSRDRITNVQALAYTGGQLFIGDIGGTRERVAILQMDRPLPGTEINRSITIALAYPDGAHDAAAILVNANQRLFVVTRGKNAGLYAAPENPQALAPWQTTAAPVNKLTRVAGAPEDVTDATVLVDGRFALRSTSQGVVVLDGATFATLGAQPVTVRQRGGGLTQSLDQGLLLAGAGADGSVVAVAIPGPAPARPTAASTRRPAEQVTATPPEADRSVAQTGTMVALVAAVGVALLGAGVVLVKR